ncbi:hypothetical protein [Paraflavitalea pollutisoli]|uniref:hypothetical protein n=1 Tax=Paraflavitalea pollutisoli TaxID=3034143 RepID=UPI0023EB37D7|nr:hypothetical protein [Paraflavitalea sp. H1-2-19X]
MKQERPSSPFFTNDDSPVPPVPPADAWRSMRARLDAQAAAGRKRRGTFWLSPVGCAALLFLLVGSGAGIWWMTQSAPPAVTEKQPVVSPDSLTAATEPIKNINEPVNPGVAVSGQAAQSSTRPVTRQHSLGHRALPKASRINYPIARREELPATTAEQTGRAATVSKPIQLASVSRSNYGSPIRVLSPRPMAYGWLQIPQPLNALCEVFPSRRYQWAVGLQTELSLPVASPYVYFTDLQLRERFYIPFIPGAWASVTKGRHRLLLELKPFSHALLPGHDQLDSTNLEGRSLVKVFGMQAGLGYSYRIDAHWWLGASIVGSVWRKGIASLENYPAPPKVNLSPIALQGEPFRPAAIGATIQVAYATGRWQGMLQVESPFGTGNTGKLMVWSRVGVRYQLWQSASDFQ